MTVVKGRNRFRLLNSSSLSCLGLIHFVCCGDSCRAVLRVLLYHYYYFDPCAEKTCTAPNAYSLPPALGTGLAPAFSISGRGKSPIDERVLNPGPGAYESGNQDKYKARSPSYSISSRTNIPTDQTQKPGPGAHSPEKVRLFFVNFTCPKLFSSRKLHTTRTPFFLPLKNPSVLICASLTNFAPPNSLK